MNGLIMVAIAGAGLGLILVLFMLFKKGKGLIKRFPKDYLLVFLTYALIGLFGFTLDFGIANSPILLSTLMLLVGLSTGLLLTYYVYEKWEWGMRAGLGRKLLYLFGITLVASGAFILVFLLCEHRGWPKISVKNDLVWWLASSNLVIFLPIVIRQLHKLWNKIPMLSQLKQIFRLPIGEPPPFFETGGMNINFNFIIPLDYRSKDIVTSKVAVPIGKSLEDAFHYKVHEHNIVRRFAKQIIVAENNKRSKIYGWCFYQTEKIWWGFWERKKYLDPRGRVGVNLTNGSTVFAERIKIWN